jgi:formate dehydrogenase subunit gamma
MGTANPRARIARFTVAERLLHWLLAAAFGVLLGTGLLMSVPALEGMVPRPVAKAWHIDAAIGLAVGVVVITLAHARTIGHTISDLERFDADDRRWLAQIPRRLASGAPAPPQGRFNAGQKLNTAVVAGLMVVSYITGFLLWYGERDTAYRFAGTINVHDDLTWLLMILVAGHLYMALVNLDTRAAMAGMVRGSVDRAWALRHHAKWVADVDRTASQADPAHRTDRPVAETAAASRPPSANDRPSPDER